MAMWAWVGTGIVGIGLLAWVSRRDEGPDTRLAPPPSMAAETAGVTRAGRQPAPAVARVLGELGIAWTPRDTGFFGRWQEGERDGTRIAVQAFGKGLGLFAGDFDADQEQISDTYLGQVGEDRPLPADGSVQRLSVAVGDEAAALDARFYLYATGGDYAQLRIPGVRDGLVGLSEYAEEVMLFESGGVQVIQSEGVGADAVLADTDCAIAIHRALRGG